MSVKINSVSNIYQNRVFRLDRENVTLENDVTVNIDLIRHPGAAAMVAVSEDGKVILLKQYRHAVGDYIWEIPAGTLEPDENPLECAKRELIEESGFSAVNWQKLGEITPVPGYSDERIHLFLAAGLSPAQQNLDQGEILKVYHIDFKDAIRMIYEQKIQDAKTICGLMLAQKNIS